MKKFLLGAALGAGVGSIVTSVFIFDRAMQSPHIRAGMKDAISDRVEVFLFGEVSKRPLRSVIDYRNYSRRTDHENTARGSA